MTMKSSLIIGCVTLVVASTALAGLVGTLSPASDSNSNGEQDGGVLQRGLRALRRGNTNLPLRIIVITNNDDGDDDWWGDDWYTSAPGPNHGGHFYAEEEDYIFVYKPVDTQYITPTKGGYGGRQGRALADIRFNKCPPIIEGYQTNAWRYAPSRDYVKGVHASVFPLMPSDFPLSGEKAAMLRQETMADSVVLSGDFQLHGSNDATYWLDDATINPFYPGDADGKYWDELRHVVEVQLARRNGDLPSSLNRWPDMWNDKTTLEDVATAVKGEYPAFHQQSLIENMFKEGVEMYRDMGPFRSVVDFIGTEVRIAAINAWAFEAVAATNFMLKWHIGMPRPEEVAWMISNGAFTSAADGVPEDLVALIQSMNLEHAADFTAYMDGSPMHPSYPAMHSAGSTCSYWLPVICKTTPEQFCEALRVDYAVSYGRTVAGVHYQQDNIAGLNIGQRIVREQLPDMLAEKYGYDSAMISSKLKALSFDWNTFDSNDCTIGGVSTADFLAKAAL